jgi:hypothetical protein
MIVPDETAIQWIGDIGVDLQAIEMVCEINSHLRKHGLA